MTARIESLERRFRPDDELEVRQIVDASPAEIRDGEAWQRDCPQARLFFNITYRQPGSPAKVCEQ